MQTHLAYLPAASPSPPVWVGFPLHLPPTTGDANYPPQTAGRRPPKGGGGGGRLGRGGSGRGDGGGSGRGFGGGVGWGQSGRVVWGWGGGGAGGAMWGVHAPKAKRWSITGSPYLPLTAL